jgi:hypothetical protein
LHARWLGFGVRRSAGVDRCRSACARPPFLFLPSALPYSTRLVIKSQRGWCVRNGWLENKAHVQIQQRQYQHRIAIVVHTSTRIFWAGQQPFVVTSFPKPPRRTSVMEHLASTVVKLCSSIKLPRPCLGSSVAPVKAQRLAPFALERAQDRRYRRRGAWQ